MAKTKKDIAGMLVPAGLFIGIGVGFIFDQLVGAALLGLGLGFLGSFLVNYYGKK